jgi:hypothetical protein
LRVAPIHHVALSGARRGCTVSTCPRAPAGQCWLGTRQKLRRRHVSLQDRLAPSTVPVGACESGFALRPKCWAGRGSGVGEAPRQQWIVDELNQSQCMFNRTESTKD